MMGNNRRKFLKDSGMLLGGWMLVSELKAMGDVPVANPIVSSAYLGEIRLFPYGLIPAGWMSCDGSTLSVSDYQDLFNIIGGIYGSAANGKFQLPDLRGRVPIHLGGNYNALGIAEGAPKHTLTVAELPSHNHGGSANLQYAFGGEAVSSNPKANVPAKSNTYSNRFAGTYDERNDLLIDEVKLHMEAAEPHENMQPYLALNFCICVHGFPKDSTTLAAPKSFLGELRIFSFRSEVKGWIPCDGIDLPASGIYEELCKAIGQTTYGWAEPGRFRLPNLKEAAPLGLGQGPGLKNHYPGSAGGTKVVNITTNELPRHSHKVVFSSLIAEAADTINPVDSYPAEVVGENLYGAVVGNETFGSAAVQSRGADESHNNMQPFLTLNFCVSEKGDLSSGTANDYYLGEIRMLSSFDIPSRWLLCDGRELGVAQHRKLFELIGTTYGGDGVQTFRLPDLRSRVPIHYGKDNTFDLTYTLGQVGGSEKTILSLSQIPDHGHFNTEALKTHANRYVLASASGESANPTAQAKYPTITPMLKQFGKTASTHKTGAVLSAETAVEGGQVAHDNMQPFLPVNFIIASDGLLPVQS